MSPRRRACLSITGLFQRAHQGVSTHRSPCLPTAYTVMMQVSSRAWDQWTTALEAQTCDANREDDSVCLVY